MLTVPRYLFGSVLAVVACGDNLNPTTNPDAPAPPGDTSPPAVTLVVTRGSTPIPGVRAYFQNADSSLVLSTTTDANGRASAVMAAGGFVTAVDPFPPLFVQVSDELFTYADVKPGDVLELSTAASDHKLVTVTLPGANDEGIYWYRVSTSCGNVLLPATAPPISGQVWLSNCGGSADVMVVAEDSDYIARSYFYVPGVAITDETTLDFTASSYSTALTNRTYDYTNVPPYTWLGVSDLSLSSRGALYLAYATGSSTTSSVSVSMAFPQPAGVTEIVQTALEPDLYSQHYLIDWGAYSTPFSVDVGARTMAQFMGNPSITSGRMTIPDSGMSADAGLATIFNARPAEPPYERTWSWYLAAPYAAEQTLPVLPLTDGYDFNIGPTDAPEIRAWSALRLPGGYDGVREHLLAWYPLQMFGQDAAVGASGSADIVAWQVLPSAR